MYTNEDENYLKKYSNGEVAGMSSWNFSFCFGNYKTKFMYLSNYIYGLKIIVLHLLYVMLGNTKG